MHYTLAMLPFNLKCLHSPDTVFILCDNGIAAAESTRKRLVGYTMAEYLALIVASVSQVFLIRRMFNKSIGYNRV